MIKVTLVISILTVKSSYSQFENTDIGARPVGLNGAFTSLSNNSLAVFYNPAGLGQLKYREISAFYGPSPFGIGEVSTAALTYSEPLNFGTLGLGLKTFGFDLYRETNFIISYGNSFKEKIFYGLNFNFYDLNIQNYNSASTFGADIGALAYLTGFLKWGFFVKNITGSEIGESRQKLAQVYKTGLTFQPNNDLNLVLEIEKDVKFPLAFRGGLEYFINEYIDLRAGTGTQPASFTGGISINYSLFQIDYSIYNHQDLGITNQGSVTLNFGGNKSRQLAREQLKNAFK
ncbi:MAG: hypothetical protein IPL53_18040 [Ignavibacteria bacterium]|nr:hypothetical protein [Ignavibacteria bacterium]